MSPMTGSFRLGRIRGIEIRAHWSWAAIFVVLSWTFAEGGFLASYPQWNVVERWLVGVVTLLLFFGTVVAHELAHAIVAQHYGLPVPSITLFAFGGVASVAGEMPCAGKEFRVAIVGPLMSWAMGALFAAIWLATRNSPIGTVVGYLAWTNLLLGAFNLLPGFPLDGGRVLRSVVWAWNHDLLRATRVAARGGTAVAYGLIIVGAVMVVSRWPTGIWYVVVGIFLRSTARQSYREAMATVILRGITAAQLMHPPDEPVDAAMSIQQLVDRRMMSSDARAFLVQRNQRVMGLLTVSDIVKVPRDRWPSTTLGAVMIPADRVVTVTPTTSLLDALQLMQQHDVRQLPVIEDGRMLGIVSRVDLLREVEIQSRGGRSIRPGT